MQKKVKQKNVKTVTPALGKGGNRNSRWGVGGGPSGTYGGSVKYRY